MDLMGVQLRESHTTIMESGPESAVAIQRLSSLTAQHVMALHCDVAAQHAATTPASTPSCTRAHFLPHARRRTALHGLAAGAAFGARSRTALPCVQTRKTWPARGDAATTSHRMSTQRARPVGGAALAYISRRIYKAVQAADDVLVESEHPVKRLQQCAQGRRLLPTWRRQRRRQKRRRPDTATAPARQRPRHHGLQMIPL